jgi:drug/metabolite transporter (DMT)-like permease
VVGGRGRRLASGESAAVCASNPCQLGNYDTSASEWTSLLLLGVSSMYLGFFAWYRGLALAGIERGGQVQQLQALLTLLWSALLLDGT